MSAPERFSHVLLASDFDNTLVYTQGAIESGQDIPPLCARDREALAFFTAEGGLFTVSTGRAVPAFARYVETLPVNAPCVVANGAGLYDFRAGRYLYTAFLPDEVRNHVAELLQAFPRLAFEVYHADRRIHALHPNAYIRSHEHLTRAKAQVVSDFSEVDFPIIKLLFEEDRQTLDEVNAWIEARSWRGDYELVFSSDPLLEMTARGATKGGMILRLASMLHVARKDLYCIGDHNNDISMVELSAIRFAPANAIDAMKALPGIHIVSHCANGAIADVIEILDKRYRASAAQETMGGTQE